MTYRYEETIREHQPSLSVAEADFVLMALQTVNVRHVLEIGTHRGCSARLWRDVLQPELLITVDWEPMLGDFELEGIEVVKGHPSQDPRTQQAVREILAGRNVDFLFIDGGHRYDEVLADYRAYAPLVRKGGIIALHDIDVQNELHDVGRLWKSLAEDPNLITREVHDSTGMGVVWV